MAIAKQTKASLIREYLAKPEYAETGPTELATLICNENKGVKVTPQEVSTLKNKQRKAEGGGEPGKVVRRRTTSQPDNGDMGRNIGKLLEAAGAIGAEKAKQLLEIMT